MATTTTPTRSPIATRPERVPLRKLKRARAVRRGFIALLALFVGLGLVGAFGYRTGTVSASGGGYDLRLSYPAVGRPGMPVQWILHVHRDGGLPSKVTLATSVGYLDLLDLNDIEPQPLSVSADGTRVMWTFTPAPGPDLVIAIDAIIQMNAHRGATATTSLMTDGAPVVGVTYETRVAP